MEIDEKLIKHIASMARLELNDEEINSFVFELKEVINAFGKISEVDTEGIKPSFQAVEVRNALRQDEVKESLSNEDALKNAHHKKDGYFVGPKAV